MHLLVINPNSTASMTAAIGEASEAAALPDTIVTAINPTDTPPAIQGPEDGEAALPGLYRLFDDTFDAGRYDAVVVACFDDVGLAELKRRAPVPVVGIGEAAFHVATLLGSRFSVVTTLDVSVPVIERNIASYGFADRCARVRAAGVPVLTIGGGEHGDERIAVEAARAVAEDGCDTVVLGCAAMASLADRLSHDLHRPVIDGVSAAVRLAEMLVRLRTAA